MFSTADDNAAFQDVRDRRGKRELTEYNEHDERHGGYF